jgi:uncharacterized protein YmfQ (DUF2313 family)
MYLERLKKNVGYRVKLVPPASHLDAAGEALPVQDEHWIIMVVTSEYIETSSVNRHTRWLECGFP